MLNELKKKIILKKKTEWNNYSYESCLGKWLKYNICQELVIVSEPKQI
jgi:hypothetical protein